ncbi:SusC/RagA family TonB-linked outer membrane protein [Chitinophaga sp. SYP-B3965]|uniref:SusC/RagA family TonB-linked outer membrane protein n=1 Tax=Chitinophaga sp. SYP-B3965 TaxID=2663120 RepID=UPI001299E16C|nr:SusC/RagA family TonB-linked outer membrane protein [Chitinophaga sp. SYP-B3965]MRG49146.1 SusC/RagA family TonB-linked outer membrane protein [Chitinophaga sp. SYP-B3965]
MNLILSSPRLILILLLLLPGFAALAQSTVSGKVTDSLGAPIERASVQVKGTTRGTFTGADGSYSISVPADGILLFSFLGYTNKELSVGGRTSLNVSLSSANTTLEDVVVVGYMTQSRTKATAAISKLNVAELKGSPNPNPIQALQGKIAGVSIPISSGQPGEGANNIIIRGSTKLNAYGTGIGTSGGNVVSTDRNVSPLVVIDGVFRSMSDVNPDNIESLQVMKDAASTAIYGARGANGVIVIKTKGGKANSKMNLSINHRSTWETQPRDYKYLNATDYLKLARTTIKNTPDNLDKNNLLNNGGFSAGTRVYTAKGQYGKNVNLTALYDNIVAIEGQAYVDNLLAHGYMTMDDPINPGTKLLYADNNYENLIWGTGLSSNTNVSVDGGSEKANYNVALGYTDQQGTFVGTSYKRYDALGNFSFQAADNFKIDAMLNYQNVLPNYVDNFTNDLTRGTRITPLIRIYKDDGNPALGELWSARNRLHTVKYDDTRTSTERVVTRLAGDWTIIPGLHFRPSISYLISDYRYMFMRKATPADEIQPTYQRQKNEATNNSRQLMIDQVLQYDFDLNKKHHFTVLGGFNYTRETNSNINIGSQRATSDYIYTILEPPTTNINGAPVTNVIDFGTLLGETRSASLFGQMNYDYDAKYLFSASLRYDGFSNFAPENKFAYFPSFSAGWNIHRENFWHVKPVSTFKLRGSYGWVGASDLSISDTYGGYNAYSYAQGSGILRSNLGNSTLKWEGTESLDLAIDAGFLNDRITLTVDWYNKLTKNRLTPKPLPSEAPFASIMYNNGTLQNTGIEVEIGGTVLQVKDFRWNTGFSFAYNKQMIKALPKNDRLKNRQGGDVVWDPASKSLVEAGGLAEGERPFALYAYQVLGVFSTDAEAAAWNATKRDNLASASGLAVGKRAGDFIFADINNDGVIDPKDQVFMGYRTPDKTGGWQNTFSWKGISLRVAMDYAMGHMISNGALARSLGTGRAFNEGAPEQALGPDIWQKSGDVGKKYARFSFADFDFGQRNYLRGATLGVNNSYSSDVSVMYEKGDFLAFREITLSYDVPRHIMKKIRSTGMNIFASVYNLGYLTKYEGINPETYTGFDAIGYPRPRQFSLGATVKF